MRTNPELSRNLWLELSPYRLVSMPLILAALFCLAYVSDDYSFSKTVASSAVGLFFVISLLWGTKLASETVMNELRDHTWDGQRMSALTPWELTCGKLFGSTVYSWYGAFFCLAVYWFAASGNDPWRTLKTLLALIVTGLLAHSVSLLASLLALQKERRFNRSQAALLLFFGLFSAGPFFSLIFNKSADVSWYGAQYPNLDLLLLSLMAFASWGVIGVNLLMRLELQMKNLPWIWYSFALFLMLYLAGFAGSSSTATAPGLAMAAPVPLVAYFVALGLVYAMAFVERKDFISLQGLLRLAASREWLPILERSPRWLLTVPLVFLAGLWLLLTARSGTGSLAAFVAANLCFLGRDLGIMLFCNLGKNRKRADLLAIICLALLHGVIPAIFTVMKMNSATLLFWPRIDLSVLMPCTAALLELLLVAWLVSFRWRQRSGQGGRS